MKQHHQKFRLERIFKQTWEVYKIIGEAALSTLGKVYDYHFVADFVKEQFENVLGTHANPDARALWIVIDDDSGTIVGVIAGAIVGRVCQEICWYVKPGFRREGGHGVRLLRAMEDWAKEKKCNYVLVSRFKLPVNNKTYVPMKELLIRKLK